MSRVRLTDLGPWVQSSGLVLNRLINFTTMNSYMLWGFYPQAYLVPTNLYHGHRDIIVDDDGLIFFSGENQHCRPSLVPIEAGAFHQMLQAEMDRNEVGMWITVRHTDTIELYMLKGEGQGEWRIFIGRGILKPKEFKQDLR